MSWELYDPDEGKKNYWSHIFKMWMLWVVITLCIITVLS